MAFRSSRTGTSSLAAAGVQSTSHQSREAPSKQLEKLDKAIAEAKQEMNTNFTYASQAALRLQDQMERCSIVTGALQEQMQIWTEAFIQWQPHMEKMQQWLDAQPQNERVQDENVNMNQQVEEAKSGITKTPKTAGKTPRKVNFVGLSPASSDPPMSDRAPDGYMTPVFSMKRPGFVTSTGRKLHGTPAPSALKARAKASTLAYPEEAEEILPAEEKKVQVAPPRVAMTPFLSSRMGLNTEQPSATPNLGATATALHRQALLTPKPSVQYASSDSEATPEFSPTVTMRLGIGPDGRLLDPPTRKQESSVSATTPSSDDIRALPNRRDTLASDTSEDWQLEKDITEMLTRHGHSPVLSRARAPPKEEAVEQQKDVAVKEEETKSEVALGEEEMKWQAPTKEVETKKEPLFERPELPKRLRVPSTAAAPPPSPPPAAVASASKGLPVPLLRPSFLVENRREDEEYDGFASDDENFTGMLTSSPAVNRAYNLKRQSVPLTSITSAMRSMKMKQDNQDEEDEDDEDDYDAHRFNTREEDMTISIAPAFDLSLFPVAYQSGPRAQQIRETYHKFKASNDYKSGHVMTLGSLKYNLPTFDNDTLLLMTDLLLRKKLIRRTVTAQGEVGWYLRQ